MSYEKHKTLEKALHTLKATFDSIPNGKPMKVIYNSVYFPSMDGINLVPYLLVGWFCKQFVEKEQGRCTFSWSSTFTWRFALICIWKTIIHSHCRRIRTQDSSKDQDTIHCRCRSRNAKFNFSRKRLFQLSLLPQACLLFECFSHCSSSIQKEVWNRI